jgi:hypothetical protein
MKTGQIKIDVAGALRNLERNGEQSPAMRALTRVRTNGGTVKRYVVQTNIVSRLEHILIEVGAEDAEDAYTDAPVLGYSDDAGNEPVEFETSQEFPTKKAAITWFKANTNYYKDGW